MTDHTLPERLRELLSKATPGPWQLYVPEDGTGAGVVKRVSKDDEGRRRIDWPAVCSCNTLPNADNAALIVETINALPHLLDALDSLSAEREAVVAWLRSVRDELEKADDHDSMERADQTDVLADAIQRAEHLPEPSPSVGLNHDDLGFMRKGSGSVPGRMRV